MSNARIRQLSAGARTDGVSVELHYAGDTPAHLLVLWPPQSTVIEPTPRAIAELGRAMVRVLSTAQTELLRIHKGGKLS